MATGCFKILTLLTLLSLLSFPVPTTSISTRDLDALLTLLRANGHSLFANAISTSDLLFDLLSIPSLTLLAPTDPSLFALDMTQTPSFYLSTLRLHALPLRLSWSNLFNLPNGSFLPTLLPSRHLRLTRGHITNVLVVAGGGGGGVEVVMPGLYYGSHVAVHGLAGILTFRFKIGSPSSISNRTIFFPPVPRTPVTPPVFHPTIPEILPKIHPNHTNRSYASPVNRTVLSPPVDHTIVSPVPTNNTNRTDSSSVNRTIPSPPVDHTIVSPVPTNYTNRTDSSSVNRTIPSPPVGHTIASPVPVPAAFDGSSSAESAKDPDVSKRISSEFIMSPEDAITWDDELGIEIPQDW